MFVRLEKGASVAQLVTPSSALPQSNRAKQSSKVSVEMASKPSPPTPVSKELPGTQQTRNRQAEERLDDEPSISSGSETDRENDQSDDDEVLSHFSGASLNLLAFYFCTYLLYLIKGECPLLYCLYFLKLVFTKKI